MYEVIVYFTVGDHETIVVRADGAFPTTEDADAWIAQAKFVFGAQVQALGIEFEVVS